ncbi:MAG: adenylate kinase [Ignavibacteria bacterium]|nr:adenylate kinase [Ignavibacteria bacterium]
MYQLIIYGPPGVGKGTQAALIAEKLNIEHISTGEILRKAITDGTDLGKKAKEIMDKGNLVSDEIMNGIVKECLSNTLKTGFILDGYPRTLKQAVELSKIFDELGYKNIKVINLNADVKEITKRLLNRGRTDDTEKTIANRLKVYFDSTIPVKEYYDKLKISIDLDGVGDKEEINEIILKAIR